MTFDARSFVALPNLALALVDRSFEEVADAAGISVERLSSVVRGTTIPNPDLRARLAAALGVADVGTLFLRHEYLAASDDDDRLDPTLGERVARIARDGSPDLHR